MVKTVSTRFALASLAVVVTLPLIGCVDARGSYDEFGDRLTDAGSGGVDGQTVDKLPAVSGNWRLVVHPANLPEDRLLFFDAHLDLTTITQNTGTIDMSAQPLSVSDLTEVGVAFVANDRAVANDATFDAPFVGTLPGAANPVTGSDIAVNSTLDALLKTDDFVCGTMSGMAGSLPLDGTTWAGVRVEAVGTTHVFRCEDQPSP